MSSHVALKTVWIWIYTVYKRVDICNAWFHTVFESVNCLSTANLYHRTSEIFFGQVHYGHLLVPGQVENFTISTPLA